MRFSTIKYTQKKPAILLVSFVHQSRFHGPTKKQSNCSKNIENHKKTIIYIEYATQKISFIQCIKYHELEITLNYLIVRHYYLEIPIPDHNIKESQSLLYYGCAVE